MHGGREGEKPEVVRGGPGRGKEGTNDTKSFPPASISPLLPRDRRRRRPLKGKRSRGLSYTVPTVATPLLHLVSFTRAAVRW